MNIWKLNDIWKIKQYIEINKTLFDEHYEGKLVEINNRGIAFEIERDWYLIDVEFRDTLILLGGCLDWIATWSLEKWSGINTKGNELHIMMHHNAEHLLRIRRILLNYSSIELGTYIKYYIEFAKGMIKNKGNLKEYIVLKFPENWVNIKGDDFSKKLWNIINDYSHANTNIPLYESESLKFDDWNYKLLAILSLLIENTIKELFSVYGIENEFSSFTFLFNRDKKLIKHRNEVINEIG